jgi:hypothetical protein
MKTRSGFVSNSSSSSFVIALARLPKSAEELHGWMFPDGPCDINPYGDVISSQQAAAQAFEDLTEKSRLTYDQMVAEFGTGTIYCSIKEIGWPEHPDWSAGDTPEDRKSLYDKYAAELKAAARKLADAFICMNPKAEFHRVEYSDDDGEFYTVMEHGGVFDNLPHQCISHH